MSNRTDKRAKRTRRAIPRAPLVFVLSASACGWPDASALDASALDASALDASALDASALDASALDASTLDAGVPGSWSWADARLVAGARVGRASWLSTVLVADVVTGSGGHALDAGRMRLLSTDGGATWSMAYVPSAADLAAIDWVAR